ncbi:MAG: hypothetical protein RXR20_13760 [Paraburkholderia sp.]|jgi:hypothetical protein|uniref:hypothetical protein n=1 Tax=Burkholderiaceae TaxID=119060 RepID=UPI0010F4542A|nr:hypothetical protein [Burkholderia sp. 4M9327F10]
MQGTKEKRKAETPLADDLKRYYQTRAQLSSLPDGSRRMVDEEFNDRREPVVTRSVLLIPGQKPIVEFPLSTPSTTKRRRAKKAPIESIPLKDRKVLTVKEVAARYPYSESALRHLIFDAEAYIKHPKEGLKSNGFADCIRRPPRQRKVLIDVEQFEAWMRGPKA